MVRVSRKLKKVDTRPIYIGVPRVAGFYFSQRLSSFGLRRNP